MNCRTENQWKRDINEKFSYIFNGGKVLEIGAGIAGSQGYFTGAQHFGLDVCPFVSVNFVCKAHEFDAPDGSYDAVCSFSALEHDLYWKLTLKKMVKLTRSGGLVFFSCCRNWEEHGTKRTSPEQSLSTQVSEEWANYYENRTPEDIAKVWNIPKLFSEHYLGLNPYDDGLTVFWGIKK